MGLVIWLKRTYSLRYIAGIPWIKSIINNKSIFILELVIEYYYKWWCKEIIFNLLNCFMKDQTEMKLFVEELIK
jgi:hypothetical protein